jgi:hypothetical protein
VSSVRKVWKLPAIVLVSSPEELAALAAASAALTGVVPETTPGFTAAVGPMEVVAMLAP